MAAPSTYSARLGSSEIRLLNLLPGNWSTPLKCTVSTVSLSAAPAYYALSYVWGDEISAISIELDGVAQSTTKNLEIALRYIRSETLPYTIWIDALCINQQDIEERNRQVSIMHKIYATASQVLIWIGEADALTDSAFDAVTAVEQGKSTAEAIEDATQFHMAYVSKQPWFSRVWTMQEMALATEDPLVICGRKTVRWQTLYTTWQALAGRLLGDFGMFAEPQAKTAFGMGYFEGGKFDALNGLRKEVQTNGGETFSQAYFLSRTSVSKEPKDRIYALLQILKPSDRAEFPVDYAKPTATVFAEAMAHGF